MADVNSIIRGVINDDLLQMQWSEDGITWLPDTPTYKGARFYRWTFDGAETERYEKFYTASSKIKYRQIPSTNTVADAICEMADAIRKHQA